MPNLSSVKRGVCLLVLLVAVASSLSARRVFSFEELLPLIPLVGDYVRSPASNKLLQVVRVDYHPGGVFHMVFTYFDEDGFIVLVFTNDVLIIDLIGDVFSNHGTFNCFFDWDLVHFMDSVTFGYRPFFILSGSGDVFPSGVVNVSYQVDYLNFSDNQLDNFILVSFSGSGGWNEVPHPVILCPDGRLKFFTPYKG